MYLPFPCYSSHDTPCPFDYAAGLNAGRLCHQIRLSCSFKQEKNDKKYYFGNTLSALHSETQWELFRYISLQLLTRMSLLSVIARCPQGESYCANLENATSKFNQSTVMSCTLPIHGQRPKFVDISNGICVTH